MNQVKATACKPNQMDYSFEKNSISQGDKKCLALRGALQFGNCCIFTAVGKITQKEETLKLRTGFAI